jgi:type VI secretion system VasD/TssJ family lipoprotein
MKHALLSVLCGSLLSGCAALRSMEESVTSTLETIPMLKMLGIESRKTQEGKVMVAASADVSAKADAAAEVGLVLMLEAAQWLNPNALQTSAPVRVWMFELQDVQAFSTADTAALLADPAKVLGADLRRVRDTILAPGEGVSVQWTTRGLGFVGILADFQTPPQAPLQSRQLIAFDGKTPSTWEVRLSGNTLLTVVNVTQSSRPTSRIDDQPLRGKASAASPSSTNKPNTPWKK